jgi:hypothetical protein
MMLEREVVADREVVRRRRVRGDDRVADLEALGGRDVALLAVRVGEERDVGGAVGIVLDRLDLRRDVEDVALEVDDPVELLVAAARCGARSRGRRRCGRRSCAWLGQGALGALLGEADRPCSAR